MNNITQYTTTPVSDKKDLDLFAERIKTYIEPMLFGEQVGYVDAIMQAYHKGESVYKVKSRFQAQMDKINRGADSRWSADYNLIDRRIKQAYHMLFWFGNCASDDSDEVAEALKKIHHRALTIMLPDEYNKVFGDLLHYNR